MIAMRNDSRNSGPYYGAVLVQLHISTRRVMRRFFDDCTAISKPHELASHDQLLRGYFTVKIRGPAGADNWT